jgi:hypothetical protein
MLGQKSVFVSEPSKMHRTFSYFLQLYMHYVIIIVCVKRVKRSKIQAQVYAFESNFLNGVGVEQKHVNMVNISYKYTYFFNCFSDNTAKLYKDLSWCWCLYK